MDISLEGSGNPVASSDVQTKRSWNSFRVKRPKSASDARASFWYRIIVILIGTLPAWATLTVFGALNEYEIQSWMIITSVALSAVPLLLGELFRKSFFDLLLRQVNEEVTVKVSRQGLTFSDDDINLLGSFEESTHGANHYLYSKIFKRILDIVISAILLIIISPVFVLIAIFIAMDGGSPLYIQRRIGRNGSVFRTFKLRTMVPDAESKLEEYLASNPEAKKEWDTVQKLRNDPRVTQIGKVLRKTSFDELPQLFNVLYGDMSLVGPRPILPEQVSLYEGVYDGTYYFQVRPGIFGLWQVSDRIELTFEARKKFDRTYAENISFWNDLKIIIKAISRIVKGTAY